MSKVKTEFGAEVDLVKAEDHAYFIASSLQALYIAMPDDAQSDEVAAKFLIGHLADLAEQLALSLGGNRSLLLGQMKEAGHV